MVIWFSKIDHFCLYILLYITVLYPVIFFLYLFLALSGALALSTIENLPFLTCLFETSSAIATVGLSFGITPALSVVSKSILIILMFMGRVGGLTLIYATVSRRGTMAKLPQERITVG